MAQDLKSLRDYEDRTLEMLTESEQHLLDRHDLIENLTRSKITSDEISNRYRENEYNERQINLARQCYVSLAKRGSLLYFLINYLSRLNIMYQFSLTWFQRTFHSCILDRDTTRRMSMTNITTDLDPVQLYTKQQYQRRRSSTLSGSLTSPRNSISEELTHEQIQPDSSKTKHHTKLFVPSVNSQQQTATLNLMIDRLTYTIYQLVSWSLFAEHQLLFSFLLTTTIEREVNHVKRNTTRSEVIREEEEEEERKRKTNNEPEIKSSLITHDEWTCFMSPLITNINEDKLSFINEQLPSLYSICQNLLLDTDQEFFKYPNPYKYLTHHSNYRHLSRFQCILIIKIFRPELLLPSISQYVAERMGTKFLSSGFADIQDIYTHSSPQAPIILLLSPGRLF